MKIDKEKIYLGLRLINIFNFFAFLGVAMVSMTIGNMTTAFILFCVSLFYFYVSCYVIKIDFLDRIHGR